MLPPPPRCRSINTKMRQHALFCSERLIYVLSLSYRSMKFTEKWHRFFNPMPILPKLSQKELRKARNLRYYYSHRAEIRQKRKEYYHFYGK